MEFSPFSLLLFLVSFSCRTYNGADESEEVHLLAVDEKPDQNISYSNTLPQYITNVICFWILSVMQCVAMLCTVPLSVCLMHPKTIPFSSAFCSYERHYQDVYEENTQARKVILNTQRAYAACMQDVECPVPCLKLAHIAVVMMQKVLFTYLHSPLQINALANWVNNCVGCCMAQNAFSTPYVSHNIQSKFYMINLLNDTDVKRCAVYVSVPIILSFYRHTHTNTLSYFSCVSHDYATFGIFDG